MQARSVSVNVYFNGKNITGEITSYLKSVSFSDSLEGEADTAEISLQDRERLFISTWFPQRGDTCKIEIVKSNWLGRETLPLGTFEVDEIKNTYPPNVAVIKCNSIPSSAQIRSVDKSASWENVPLRQIAQDVASYAGLQLYYDTDEDPVINRAELREESGLKFLQRLCRNRGLALKVTDGKLIIFDEEKYEKRPAVKVLSYGDSVIKRFDGTATLSKIYSECHVKSTNARQCEFYESRCKDASKRKGMTLEITRKLDSQEEAERLAKKSLRDKNKEEIKVQLQCVGDFAFLAGNVIELDSSFGFYAGNYIIEKAEHKIGGGYECSVDLRKCLNGY